MDYLGVWALFLPGFATAIYHKGMYMSYIQ